MRLRRGWSDYDDEGVGLARGVNGAAVTGERAPCLGDVDRGREVEWITVKWRKKERDFYAGGGDEENSRSWGAVIAAGGWGESRGGSRGGLARHG
jgi:hypothetical protein